MKYLSTEKTSKDLVANAFNVYEQFKQGKTPSLNGVVWEHAKNLGWCQQAIRELVEATVYGKEGVWQHSSCCAGNTCKKLKDAGFQSYSWDEVQVGDIVYTANGPTCSTCGGGVGHVMCMVKSDGSMWQNTSYQGLGLCIIPMRQEQIGRISGIFRLLPPAEHETLKIIDVGTNKILAELDGKWVIAGDHIKDQGKVYLKHVA